MEMETEKIPDRVGLLLIAILPLCYSGQWLTIDEMTELTQLHPSVVRWCIRQLKTGDEGDFIIRKKRRASVLAPTEYWIRRKPRQTTFPFSDVK